MQLRHWSHQRHRQLDVVSLKWLSALMVAALKAVSIQSLNQLVAAMNSLEMLGARDLLEHTAIITKLPWNSSANKNAKEIYSWRLRNTCGMFATPMIKDPWGCNQLAIDQNTSSSQSKSMSKDSAKDGVREIKWMFLVTDLSTNMFLHFWTHLG